jgi:hypothetical protein
MKKFLPLLFAVAVVFAACGTASAKLPRDYAEFKARYQKEGRTMEGAAHLYFEAVFCYMNEAARAEASKMIRYAMYLSMPFEQSNNYRTFAERLKDESCHYIFRSFAVGATPENSYKMSPDNFKLEFISKRKESDFTHLYLRSSGADSPRSIWMQERDGLWYVINNAGTYAEVRPPKSAEDTRKNAHDADFDAPSPPATGKNGEESGVQNDSSGSPDMGDTDDAEEDFWIMPGD